MGPLELVRLGDVMGRTSGASQVTIGLIDGPVDTTHPGLSGATLRGDTTGCRTSPASCTHATFIAGILSGRPDAQALGICPDCPIHIQPIFTDEPSTATNAGLAQAISECIDAGVRILSVSAGPPEPDVSDHPVLLAALDSAARRGVLVVAAAGNAPTLGSTTLTRHPWVLPVTATDEWGQPTRGSTLARSIGHNGVAAPGTLTSLVPGGGIATLSGTSFAAPLVAGTLALLWSSFPAASAEALRAAVLGSRRRALIPPLLNAAVAYRSLEKSYVRQNI